MTEAAQQLNLDHDEARALHRVVRAMHDGECPKCHKIFPSDRMPFSDQVPPATSHLHRRRGWRCPGCRFEITEEEAAAVIQLFGEFMDRNLAIFEKWREARKVGAK